MKSKLPSLRACRTICPRAFALAVVAAEGAGVPWDGFRQHLKSAIAEQPSRPYYESWLDALERFADDLTATAAP